RILPGAAGRCVRRSGRVLRVRSLACRRVRARVPSSSPQRRRRLQRNASDAEATSITLNRDTYRRSWAVPAPSTAGPLDRLAAGVRRIDRENPAVGTRKLERIVDPAAPDWRWRQALPGI